MKSKIIFYAVLLLSASFLAACGGGASESAQAPVTNYRVDAVAGLGGTVNPDAITVVAGEAANFTVTPDSGFVIASVSGCSGNLSGNTYTTGAINNNCTVTASFIDNSVANFTITANAGAGGNITPANVLVAQGATADFTVTPDTNFVIDTITGCSGTLNGSIYTTSAITANCTISASFLGLQPPVVDAGAGQTVDELTTVTLSGSASDADGTIVTYLWTQTAGTAVTLNNSDTATASFDAPDVVNPEILVFELQVTDDDGQLGTDSIEITVNPIVNNEIAVIAATGMPAVGFPSGHIYWTVFDPIIGDSGHIAYLGAADTSIGLTQQNRKALWAGMPNAIELIVQENDTLPDLPSNVLYGGNNGSGGNVPNIIVNTNGNLAHYTSLKGAVTDRNDTVLLVHENNNLHKVMRKGEQIDGLPTGSTYGSLLRYDFSNAGLVFTAEVVTGNASTAYGVWFWDFNEITLLAFMDLSFDDALYDLPEETPNIDGGNCKFTFGATRIIRVNDRGDIAFQSAFSNRGASTCSYSEALLKWSAGSFTPIVSNGQAVAGLNGYNFSRFTAAFENFTLHPNGDVGLHSTIGTGVGSAQGARSLFWVRKENGDQEYLAIGGELLPGSSSQTLVNNLGLLGVAPIADDQGNYLISALDSANPQEVYLLKGTSSTLPYNDISEVAASGLSTLVKVGDVPPEYPSTAFFSTIQRHLILAPAMNADGEVTFIANRADALDSQVDVIGLWHIDEAGDIKKLLEQGDTVPFNGENVGVVSFLSRVLSNTGQVVVSGRLTTAFQAVLLITP